MTAAVPGGGRAVTAVSHVSAVGRPEAMSVIVGAVEARRVGSSVLVGWRTQRSLAFVLDVVRQVGGDALIEDDDACALLRDDDDDGNDELEGSSAEILDEVLAHPDDVLAASIRFDGLAFAWVAEQGVTVDVEASATCNARLEPYSRDKLAVMLGTTAVRWDAAALSVLERGLESNPL